MGGHFRGVRQAGRQAGKLAGERVSKVESSLAESRVKFLIRWKVGGCIHIDSRHYLIYASPRDKLFAHVSYFISFRANLDTQLELDLDDE